jgi:hypothetical protein
MLIQSQAWWYMPVISALRRLKQEEVEFKASLEIRDYLKKKKK